MGQQTLSLKAVSFCYESAQTPVLKNFSATFSQGWSAIIGANGSGKTTLARIIAEELTPQTGTISGGQVLYASQRDDLAEAWYHDFIESYDRHAIKLKEKLSLCDHIEWQALSHGERRRIQVGAALWMRPDILILDEPTNHLDEESRNWTISALKQFRGIGILISHDRDLLQALATSVYIMTEYGTHHFSCGIEEALQAYHQKYEATQKEHKELSRKINNLDAERTSRTTKAKESKKRLSKKGVAKGDHDTKAKIDGARLTGKDNSDSAVAKRLESRISKLKEKQNHLNYKKNHRLGIALESKHERKQHTCTISATEYTPFPNFTIKIPSIIIATGDRIVITGKNGVGKSVFLNYLSQQIKTKENIFYLPQEVTLDESQKHITRIRSKNRAEIGTIMTLVRRLGSNPKALLDTEIPSPGEMRKLLLAEALLGELSTIILDEPTNHLDLPTIEMLETALNEWQGTLILISHDTLFRKRCSTRTLSIIEINDQRLVKELV